MEQNIHLFNNKLVFFFSRAHLRSFVQTIQPYLQELQEFRFSFYNPAFWLFILIVLLILSRIWGLKKAFSYCLVISVILYLTTQLIAYTNLPIDGSGFTGADLVKLIAVIIVAIITIYYYLIKRE